MARKPDTGTDLYAALKWALEQSSDNPVDYFEWLKKRVEVGSFSSAVDMLHGFCMYIDQGQSVPKPILNYLSLAISAYLSPGNSESLEKLLGLTRPAHRRHGTGVDRIPIVAYMYLCIKRDNMNREAAAQAAAERFYTTKRTVQRYDKDPDLNQIPTLDSKELELLAQTKPLSIADKK